MRAKKRPMDDDTGFVAIRSAARMLDCSTAKIYALHRAGRLELVKLDPRMTRVTRRSLLKLLKDVMANRVVLKP